MSKRYSTVGGTAHDETQVGAHRRLLSYSLKPQGTDIFLRDTGQQQSANIIKKDEYFSLSLSVSHVYIKCKCHLLVSSRVGGSGSPRRSNSTALWTQGVALLTLNHNSVQSLLKRQLQIYPP